MELVYLWVEDYKNIKKQGFNFSPRFNCNYIEKSKELTIDEQKDYVSIFPNNINITAIVGENGSGKSSLIEILFQILFQDEYRKNRNKRQLNEYILFFMNEEKILFYSENKQLINKLETNCYKLISKEELLKNYYLLMDFSLGQNSIYNSKIDYKNNFSLEPSRISMTKSSSEFLGKIESNAFNNNMKVNVLFFYFLIKKYKLNSILEKLNLPNFETLNYLKPSSFSDINKEEKFIKFKKEKTLFFGYKFERIDSYKELVDDLSTKFINIQIEELSLSDMLEFEKMFYFISIDIRNEKIFFEDLSTGQKLLISYYGIIIRTILSIKNKESISIVFDEVENSLHPKWQKYFIKNILILMKEISQINENHIKTNLIFLTHSPFLLSDLPKENIIFLDKYKKDDSEVEKKEQSIGNCKNVSQSIAITETFGANIHTLLSDGFFMSDGLMGEFAKDKIQSIIKYHDEIITKELLKEENEQLRKSEKDRYSREFKSNFWNIQSIIGDDYLKQVVKNHLIEIEKIVLGNDEAKEEEIKRLENQIKELRK